MGAVRSRRGGSGQQEAAGDGSGSTARQTRSQHVREPRDDAFPLPRLVGVERSVELVIGEGSGAEVVRYIPEESHDGQLTRPYATASVITSASS